MRVRIPVSRVEVDAFLINNCHHIKVKSGTDLRQLLIVILLKVYFHLKKSRYVLNVCLLKNELFADFVAQIFSEDASSDKRCAISPQSTQLLSLLFIC